MSYPSINDDFKKALDLIALKERFPDLNVDQVQPFRMVALNGAHMMLALEAYLSQFNLSPARMHVFSTLLRPDCTDGVEISELKKRYQVKSATITGILNSMEKDGLIERVRHSEDRRKILVRIADKGLQFVDETLPLHLKKVKKVIDQFSQEELDTLMGLQQKMAKALCSETEGKQCSMAENNNKHSGNRDE